MLSVSKEFSNFYKKEILMIRIPVIHVHGNITFYYVHVNSNILWMFAAGISITIIIKLHVLEN